MPKPKAKPDSEKTVENEQRIDQKIKQTILDLIEKDPSFLEGLIYNNPNLIAQYLPKVKDTEASLTESHLSLRESYEHLKDIPDFTNIIAGLEQEIMRLSTLIEVERQFSNNVLRNIYNRIDPVGYEGYNIAARFYRILRYLSHKYDQVMYDSRETTPDIKEVMKYIRKAVPYWDTLDHFRDRLDREFKRTNYIPVSKTIEKKYEGKEPRQLEYFKNNDITTPLSDEAEKLTEFVTEQPGL